MSAPSKRLPPWLMWLVRHGFGVGYTLVVLTVFTAIFGVARWSRLALALSGVFAAVFTALRLITARWRTSAIDHMRQTVGDRDPGDSPVAWISTQLWRREQKWNPEYELDHGQAEKQPCVDEPSVVVAEEKDRLQAPMVAVAASLPVPGAGSQRALLNPPTASGLRVHSPSWPSCCDRLTTLVGLYALDEEFQDALPRAHFLHAEVANGLGLEPYGKESLEEGHACFHCRSCGRVYLGSYHP